MHGFRMFMFFMFASILLVLTSSSLSFAGDKWLNYGNGMVNLSMVSRIDPFGDATGGKINFDNFELRVFSTHDLLGELQEKYGSGTQKTIEKIGELRKENEERVMKYYNEIVDFIDSKDTYKKW